MGKAVNKKKTLNIMEKCPSCGHIHGTDPCPECTCGHSTLCPICNHEHEPGTECHEPDCACGHNNP